MEDKKLLSETEDQMKKALEGARHELSKVRTGKASPALLDSIKVDYYGTMVPVLQLGNITAPEARMLMVTPYDKGALKAVAAAIRSSDLGLNPQEDGAIIRVPIPAPTEERRRDMVKLVAKYVEEGRVHVRLIRREANDRLKKLEKDGHVSEDDIKRLQDQIQKLTDSHILLLDEMLGRKQAEVMEV